MRRRLTARRSSATPAFRRSRSRSALATEEAAPEAADGLLFGGLRRTLGVVLERLNQNSRRIVGVWRRLLRRLDATNDGNATLASLDLAACYRHLSLGGRRGTTAGDEAYRLAVERGTRTLLRAGVPEEHAIAAIALYLEACLGYLERPAETRALIRLTSATQGLVAAGYCEERVAGLRRLDDRERQKLSGDLHDEVGADLVVLKLYVEMIAVELEKAGAAPVGPKLQEALALIAHAVESVRRLTLDLGPAFLDALGFLPALRGFVRQFSLRTGIKVELHEADAPISIPVSHETALYRVLRGALSNVAKHSTARHVRVSLSGGADVFVMSVEDDGKGFDVRAQVPDHTVGLAAMRERIRGLRGRLSIDSWVALKRGERSGTRIEVRLPLRRRTAA